MNYETINIEKVEVINAGGICYASYRLLDLVDECLNYEPDLIIVMCGHNEFLEPRHYGNLQTKNSWPVWEQLRLVQFLGAVGSRLHLLQKRKPENTISLGAEYIGEPQKEIVLVKG